MWYRKYLAGTMLIMGIMLLAGPAKSQESANINDLLFNRLTDEEKTRLVSDLGMGYSGDILKGIEFKGTLTEQTRTITETRTEMNSDPLPIQSLTGRNCGSYEDTVHLTVTESKERTEERHSESHWSVSTSLRVQYNWLSGETEGTIGGEGGHAWGKSTSNTSTTAWDQSVDVVVPPHQSLEVNFMAFKQTVEADYTRIFVATGEAVASTEEVVPTKVTVRCANDEYLVYYQPTVDLFVGDACDKNLRGITIEGPDGIVVEMFEHPDYIGRQVGMVQKGVEDVDSLLGVEEVRPEGEGTYYDLNNDACDNTRSLRIIDTSKPHVCLFSEDNFNGWRRCFNVGQNSDFVASDNESRNFNDKASSIRVVGVRAILYEKADFSAGTGDVYQSFETSSSTLPPELDNNVSGIKIESISGGETSDDNTFLIEDYLLDADRRTFTEKGTYESVDYVQGYFERGISTRLSRSACCDSQTGTTSIDCTDEAWASTMTGFVVYVKPKPGTDGSGVIRQNGIPCGKACTISAPLPDLPVLWKVEAVPDEGSVFSGWETESGQPLSGKHKPLPGDTVYAVFEPAPTETEPGQDETTTP